MKYTTKQTSAKKWQVIEPSGSPIHSFESEDAAIECANEMNNPKIDFKSVELDGIDERDYPDFSDAFIEYAETVDGVPLTAWQIEIVNQDSELVHELAHEFFH